MSATKNIEFLVLIGVLMVSVSGQAWISQPYKGQMLVQYPLPWSESSNGQGIKINLNDVFQTIDGFGFALTGGSAQLIQQLPTDTRTKLLEQLFSKSGLGISVLRISIGSSDLDSQPFTYDDLPSGQTDPLFLKFNLAKSENYLIPLMKDIKKINPNIKFLATPWSAPAWMKVSQSLKGGALMTQYYRVFAQYLVVYLKQMILHGLQIWAIVPQNQPLNQYNNPSMLMTASEQTEFIKRYLGPAFTLNNIHTKIIIYDHNCDRSDYPITVMNDNQAKQYITGSAFHLYSGDISALTTVKNAHPDKAVYFTEQWTSSQTGFAGDFMWHIKNVVIGSLRNYAQTVIQWNLANDQNFRPHTEGGCSECKGALTINNGQITRNQMYYIIAQASKFIPAGSQRIGISNLPNGVNGVALTIPNNQLVVLLQNQNNQQIQSSIMVQTREIKIYLPPQSAATYLLPLF